MATFLDDFVMCKKKFIASYVTVAFYQILSKYGKKQPQQDNIKTLPGANFIY